MPWQPVVATDVAYGIALLLCAGIEERIARWVLLPVTHQESLQVLKYGAGQQYRPHWDFFQVCVRLGLVVL